jgi:hypothetical protein
MTTKREFVMGLVKTASWAISYLLQGSDFLLCGEYAFRIAGPICVRVLGHDTLCMKCIDLFAATKLHRDRHNRRLTYSPAMPD